MTTTTATAESNVLFIASPKAAEFDRADYGFYLHKWLGATDTVDTCEWVFYNRAGDTVMTDLTNFRSVVSDDGKTIAVWLEDGTKQTVYKVEAQVTTVETRKKSFAFLLPVI